MQRASGLLLLVLLFGGVAWCDSADPGAVRSLAGVRVAITIDDIPRHGDLAPGISREGVSRRIIKALKDNGVAGAYGFTNGTFQRKHPEQISILKEWLAGGYSLGNHTWHHSDLDKMSVSAYEADIAKQDRLLQSLASYSPLVRHRLMFRYPYLNEGNTLAKRNAIRAYLAERGYRIAEVTADYYDWAWTDAYSRCLDRDDNKSVSWLKTHVIEAANRHLHQSEDVAKLLFNRDIAQILLIHASVFNAITLQSILESWRAHGVQFISLDEALADPVYTLNPNLPYADGRNFLEQMALARNVNIDKFRDPTYTIERLAQVCN